ncbi:MAG: Yip1 domain protein [Eubacterium sp.]|jgi:hypothetical protein|nr:Yip1 domain protein [Eubacterium sp.]
MNDNLVVTAENSNSPKLNAIQRAYSAIFSPEKLMHDLEQKPRILFVLILTLLVPAATIFAVYPIYKDFLRFTLENTYANMNIQMPAEQLEQAINVGAISGPVMGAISAAAMWFLQALILWIIVKIFKGQGTYKHYLSITGYTAVISIISGIAFVITAQITGTYSEVSFTSLAALLPEMKGSFLYGAAKSLDVFSVWQLVLIAIGIETVGKLSKKKAYLIVACILIVFMVFTGVTEVRTAGLLN